MKKSIRISNFFILLSLLLFLNIGVMGYGVDSDIGLTSSEIAFIHSNPVIRLGVDPGFVPFEFIN